MVFDESSKYCKMHLNFIIFSNKKETQNKTEKNTTAAKFRSTLTTSQNATWDISVAADTSMRLAFLKLKDF